MLLFLVRSRRRWLLAGLGAVIVGCSVAAGLVYRTPNSGATPDVYSLPVLGVVPLATGCLLALLLDDERIRTWAAGLAGHVATWAGLALLVGTMLWIGDDWAQHAWTFSVVLPLTGVVSAVLIAGLVSVRSPLSVAFAWTPVSWFGRRVSYAAYLWHPLVIALLDPFAVGPWGKVGLVGASVLVAIGAAYAVEVPVEKAQRRFREARRLVAADRAAATPPRPDATGPVGGSPIRSPTGHRTGGAWRGPPRASRSTAAGLVRLLGRRRDRSVGSPA